jgi:small conductance mechanosensitive channel
MNAVSFAIDTPENIQTIIGNNKIFIAHEVDHNAAIRLLEDQLSCIPNVLAAPAPDIKMLSFNSAGPLLTVRPYCVQPHYWQVYFDTNKAIRETFREAGYPTLEDHIVIPTPVSAATK